MKVNYLIILVLVMITTLSNAKDEVVIELLDQVRKDLTSLAAEFEQYEIDANNNFSEKSTGKLWLNAPNQFKWQYQKPLTQLIIASGKQVWIYDEDLEQVTIKQQYSQQNPIYVLLNKKQTEKHYTISLEEKKEDSIEETQWVKMIPKKPSDDVKVVWLGIDDNNLTTLKLQNQFNNLVVFNFEKIIRNPELTDDFFTFEIPKGTDVIRDKTGIGEF